MDEVLTNDDDRRPPVFSSEILPIDDPWRESLEFDDAKRKEFTGLIERGTFRIVLGEDARENLNIIPYRFALVIKQAETGDINLEVRFILGNHSDRENHQFFHYTAIVQTSPFRLIFALATILGFDAWSLDVSQAHL